MTDDEISHIAWSRFDVNFTIFKFYCVTDYLFCSGLQGGHIPNVFLMVQAAAVMEYLAAEILELALIVVLKKCSNKVCFVLCQDLLPK